MEFLTGTSVLIAVLLLGVLISSANERQRKAIDGLREQVEAWAEQDIRIKREKLVRQISVPDPLEWLEKTAAQVLGSAPRLASATPWQKDDLSAVVCLRQDGRALVFTPMPRERLLKALKVKSRSALSGIQSTMLGENPRRIPYTELSVVTNGMFFDIEAAQAWQAITGEVLPVPHLTMYEVPAPGKRKK